MSRKLLDISSKILNLAHSLDVSIVPKYLPGKYNDLADSLSRVKSQQEWHLDSQIQTLIFQKLGTPDIDLFGSKASAVVPQVRKRGSEGQQKRIYGRLQPNMELQTRLDFFHHQL